MKHEATGGDALGLSLTLILQDIFGGKGKKSAQVKQTGDVKA